MKRFMIGFAVSTALAVGPAVAEASDSSAPPSASGQGQIAYAGNVAVANFKFHATGTPSKAHGTFTQTTPAGQGVPSGSFKGKVNCLNVVGNTATLSGIVTKADGAFASDRGTGFIITVVDLDGNHPDPNNPTDQSGGTFTNVPNCTTPQPTGPIHKGDIVVKPAGQGGNGGGDEGDD